MTDKSNDPVRLAHALEQLELSNEQFWNTSRDQYEQMMRRHTTDEAQIAERMRWYDAQVGKLGSWTSSASREDGSQVLGGPMPSNASATDRPVPPPRPRPAAADVPADVDEDDDSVPEFRTPHIKIDMPETPDAPGKATRLMHTPKLYGKAVVIAGIVAGVVWLLITGLLVWLFDSAWWGWWPGLLTVPVTGFAVLVWLFYAGQEIRQWVRKGGPLPLRMRHVI